jgi:carboxylesterase type B
VLAAPNGADFEFGLLQQKLDHDRSVVQMSDTEGLNLNITVPIDSHGKVVGKNLPVFVFVHGGGFGGGSASFPQYDMARFVRLSAERGMHVVAVSLKYVVQHFFYI